MTSNSEVILETVKLYLSKANQGQVNMPEAIIEEFGEACKNLIRTQFDGSRKDDNFTIRMSGIGRPLCQQQMEVQKAPKELPHYADKFKFLIGDMIEAAGIAVMKAAKINVQDTHRKVSLDIGGMVMEGTLDVIIDDEVYDIKSASPYSFDSKFSSFANMKQSDDFGYISQGFLYAKSVAKRFAGWIAINKVTGEWNICEVPKQEKPDGYLQEIDKKIRSLIAKVPFKRCFKAEEETWYSKKTGNYILPKTCGYCPFKKPCWGKEVTLAKNPKSKSDKKQWYVGSPK